MHSRHRVRGGLGALGVLVSLGLPWTHDTSIYIPGFVTPSTCIPTADGTMWCSPGFMAPALTTGSAAAAGADSPVRVLLVAALVLVGIAVHRSSSALLMAAGAIAIGAAVLGASAVLGGPLAAAVGGVLLVQVGRRHGSPLPHGPGTTASRVGPGPDARPRAEGTTTSW